MDERDETSALDAKDNEKTTPQQENSKLPSKIPDQKSSTTTVKNEDSMETGEKPVKIENLETETDTEKDKDAIEKIDDNSMSLLENCTNSDLLEDVPMFNPTHELERMRFMSKNIHFLTLEDLESPLKVLRKKISDAEKSPKTVTERKTENDPNDQIILALKLYHSIATCYFYQNKFYHAINYFEKITPKIENLKRAPKFQKFFPDLEISFISCLYGLAMSHFHNANFRKCIHFSEKLLNYVDNCQEDTNYKYQFNSKIILFNLGFIYKHYFVEDDAKIRALDYFEQAHKLVEQGYSHNDEKVNDLEALETLRIKFQIAHTSSQINLQKYQRKAEHYYNLIFSKENAVHGYNLKDYAKLLTNYKMGKVDKKKLKLIAAIFSEYGWFLFSRKLIVEHIKESNSDSAEALPAHVTHDIAFIKKQNEAIEFLNRSLQLYDILYQDTMRKLNAGHNNNSQSQQNNRNRTHSGNVVNSMMMGPRVMTPTSIVNGRSVMSSPTFHNPICRTITMSKLFNTKPVITDYDPPKPEPKTVPSFPTLPPMPDGPPLPPSNLYGQNAPEMIDYGQDSSYQEKEEEKEDFVQPEDSNDDSNNNNIQQILEKDPEILVAKGIEEQDPHNLTTGSELNKTNLSQNASFGQQSPEFNEKSNPQPDDNNDNSKNRNKMNDQDLDLRVTITNENVIDSNNEKRRESRDKDNKQEEFGNESRSNKRSWIPLDKPSKDERKRDRHERREKRSRRHSRSRSRSKSKSRDRERRDDDKSRSSSRREHRDRREDRERREDRDHRDRKGEKNSSRRDRDRDGHRSSDHKSRRSRSRSRSKSPKKEEKERKRPRKSRFDEPKNNTFGSVPGGPLQPTANISSQINHHPVAAMLTPYAAMYGMPPMSQMPSFTPNGHIIPNSVDPRTNKNSNNSQPHPSLPKEAFPGLPPPNFGLNLPAPNFNNMAAAAANPYHMANMQKAYVSDVPTPFPDSNNIGMMNAGMVNYDDVEYQGRVKKSKKDKKDKHWFWGLKKIFSSAIRIAELSKYQVYLF